MKNGRSVETPLFLEISDNENSILSPGLLQKAEPQRSSSIPDKDVVTGSSCGDLSLPTPLNHHLVRYKKLKEAAETMVDSEFAELNAWLESGSNEVV